MAGSMQAGGPGQPHATEYTLQGVMRFLQTEWHRHERDRNAWDIERQEMKGRVAVLEGQARRADATQKALKKYVAILQNKVREQASQLRDHVGGGAPVDGKTERGREADRSAMLKEKLKGLEKPLDGTHPDIVEDEAQRAELKTFLDHCQSEFTYLMVTPANPLPPRESPHLPIEELREPDSQQQQHMAGLNRFTQQNHVAEMNPRQQQMASNHLQQMQHQMQQQQQQLQLQQQQQQQSLIMSVMPRHQDQQQLPPLHQPTAMVRSVSEHSQSGYGPPVPDWAVPGLRGAEEGSAARQNHVGDKASDNQPPPGEFRVESLGGDAWDLDFPQPGTSQPQASAAAAAAAPGRPDTDVFPSADHLAKSPTRSQNSHRRKGSMSRRHGSDHELSLGPVSHRGEGGGGASSGATFKFRFGLRGHLNIVRTVIFSGGGSPGEPEICTAGDDGTIKRFLIPRLDGRDSYDAPAQEVLASFTHRGHTGAVLCLASWAPSPYFSTGGRAQGDGWIFSGGQDASVRVWERGRVDPKATLEGHSDAVWALCVLPATLGAIFGTNSSLGPADRILLVSGAADGNVKLWSVSAPPQLTSPQPGGSTGGGGGSGSGSGSTPRTPGGRGRVRGNSMSSGSAFPLSPQPTTASSSPFHSGLIHTIGRADGSRASPTAITAMGPAGDMFVVAYADSAVVVFDTRSGEQIGQMESTDACFDADGSDGGLSALAGVNTIAATTVGVGQEAAQYGGPNTEEESGQQAAAAGPTGGRGMAGSGVEGTIISGHEDRSIRLFDANSGQCTYNMLAHPAAVSSLSLSPDGRELISAGHDASLRLWSLEKRSPVQEMAGHRIMRGEGVCAVVWSQDGRWVVSGGGDGVARVFSR